MNSNAVTLITGPSGTGKTSLLATAAEWLWKNHKKVFRLYTADGGGYGTRVQALVDAGIIQVFRMRTRAVGAGEGLVEETCMRVSQGWWPASFTDVAQGEVIPGCELRPPQQTLWTLSCPAQHIVKTAFNRSQLVGNFTCPDCKAAVSLQNGSVTQDNVIDDAFARVGGIAIEGLTSMGDWIMTSLSDRVAKNELGGEKSALGGVIRSGGMAFGSSNRSHYGFAQGQAEKWLLNSTAIPSLIIPPIWTGLEARVDEAGGVALPFYGPSIPGQAKTGKVPQWVGNYLGTQVVINEKGNREWRLYLTEYRGEDGYPHLYKVRSEPGALPTFLVDEDPKQPFQGFNLGLFFSMLEEAKKKSAAKIKQEFPDAPGLASSPVQMGNVGGVEKALVGSERSQSDFTPPTPSRLPVVGKLPTKVTVVGGPKSA